MTLLSSNHVLQIGFLLYEWNILLAPYPRPTESHLNLQKFLFSPGQKESCCISEESNTNFRADLIWLFRRNSISEAHYSMSEKNSARKHQARDISTSEVKNRPLFYSQSYLTWVPSSATSFRLCWVYAYWEMEMCEAAWKHFIWSRANQNCLHQFILFRFHLLLQVDWMLTASEVVS